MKTRDIKGLIRRLSLLICLGSITACEKDLQNQTYGTLSSTTFFKTASDAQAAVSAMYTGMMGGNNYSAGWGASAFSFRAEASQTTDEGVCYWGDGGQWVNLNTLNFTPDFSIITQQYTSLMPYISQITVNIGKIQGISMDATLKSRYIAELKALRGYYSEILYLYFGPVPIRVNAADVNNTAAAPIPRPSSQDMVSQIIKDFTEAAAALPAKFTGTDYGRFSKAACYTALLKLYMQEKRWNDAVNIGHQLKGLGYSLIPNYQDNFNINAKGGNSEIILAVVCTPTNSIYNNRWLAHALPTDYKDPSGIPLATWGGYRMPWKTYDKFNQNDKRLSVLLQKYPVGTNPDGTIKYRDARAGGDIGAVMVKFGPDPSRANSELSGIDLPVFRYADAELLLAEALNEANGGPTDEAYDLINDVRTTHGGLAAYAKGSLNHDQFLTAIQNERLFELWAEGVRRDDLIRWGLYIKRAKDDGSTFADDSKILYPLPRSVVNQSNGVIKQNPGYN
jgi:hypothetical protein